MNSDQPVNHPRAPAGEAADLPESARVAILLATYNGQHFLSSQLESIAQQTHENWHIYAADDGSVDDTLSLLQRYQKIWGSQRLSLSQGPQSGFVANFLSLVCQPTLEADFYAYADQDDVWFPDKLSRALQWLNTIPGTQPALYCSRTRLIDEQGRTVGLSPLFGRPPSFANALVQSIAGGNTMVFNSAARHLLRIAGQQAVITHDWWTYLLVSGCGGTVFYDKTPRVGYRQHTHNVVGSNRAWSAKISRANQLLAGQFRQFTAGNIQALQLMQPHLSLDSCLLLQQFCAARAQKSGLARVLALRRCRVYRQTHLDNIGLLMAVFLDKL